jgi:hypothetical protein
MARTAVGWCVVWRTTAGGGGAATGIGLRNTAARIAQLLGPTATLSITPRVPHGTCVVLELPLIRPGAEDHGAEDHGADGEIAGGASDALRAAPPRGAGTSGYTPR